MNKCVTFETIEADLLVLMADASDDFRLVVNDFGCAVVV